MGLWNKLFLMQAWVCKERGHQHSKGRIAASWSLSGLNDLQQVLIICMALCPSCLASTVKGQFLVRWGLSTSNLDVWKTWASWGMRLVLHEECTAGRNESVCPNTGGIILSAFALGERPPSAMVPSILISKSGDMLVIGGAGGGWIISATAMVSEEVLHRNTLHQSDWELNKRNICCCQYC